MSTLILEGASIKGICNFRARGLGMLLRYRSRTSLVFRLSCCHAVFPLLSNVPVGAPEVYLKSGLLFSPAFVLVFLRHARAFTDTHTTRTLVWRSVAHGRCAARAVLEPV